MAHMEERFREQLAVLKSKNKKSVLLTKDEYFELIEEVKVAAACADRAKTQRQYYVIRRYQILQCGDVEKLIKKRSDISESASEVQTLYFVHMDDMYDIIKRAHIGTGHGGRDKMLKTLSGKYANITSDVVELYKSLCTECLQKRKRHTVKGVVVKPILSSDYGSRAQIDLIDMQSMECNQNKWIMVYQVTLNLFKLNIICNFFVFNNIN